MENVMVNTYITDVFDKMDHGVHVHGTIKDPYPFMCDNAEMFITMLTEIGTNPILIPTVEELKADFYSRHSY
jgi:hypothetical protein